MIQYRIICDEKHLLESVACLRRIGWQRRVRGMLKGILFLVLSVLVALFVYVGLWPLTALFAFLALLLAIGPRADYWVYARRFRKSPFFNVEFTWQLTDDGYAGHWSGGNSELAWRMFTKARRLSEGFIVYSGADSPHWWPDSALVAGTHHDVDALLRKHMVDYVAG